MNLEQPRPRRLLTMSAALSALVLAAACSTNETPEPLERGSVDEEEATAAPQSSPSL